MSKETDAIKSKAKLWGSISNAYFVCALYLGLTHFEIHGTLEEIENAVTLCAICGLIGELCTVAYLIIRNKMLKREEEEGCDNAHE